MSRPSHEEWRDAIDGALDYNGEVQPGDDTQPILEAIAPLIERERQQARQQALAEARALYDAVDDYLSAVISRAPGIKAEKWDALSDAMAAFDHAAAGGVS